MKIHPLLDALKAIQNLAENTSKAFPNAPGASDWKQVIFIVGDAIAKLERDQLIAAELLAACQNAANILAALATGQLTAIHRDSSALSQLRAAIAKALK
jgi:hypothetical protein